MKLYFGNLPERVHDAQLSDLAKPYGTVVSASVVTDHSSGESRGFGFVELGTPEEGRAAIAALDGTDMDGQTLKVNEAKPRKDAGFRRN
ncbi:MAG: RNA-binding protein [Thermoanaerobaculia bacterium]